jgi:hypothetical protein
MGGPDPAYARAMRRQASVVGWVALALLALPVGCGGEAPESAEPRPDEETAPTTAEVSAGCVEHAECGDDEYCAFSDGTCGQAGPGVCVTMPDAAGCPLPTEGQDLTVCGCDGFTYESGCAAAAVGASVAHEGACAEAAPVDDTCGGATCGAGEYCAIDDGSCGEAGPSQGVCRPLNGVCTSASEPMCGCDGTTYASVCAAQNAGASIRWAGPC